MAKNEDPIVLDKELEVYRNVLATPTEFRNGFTWVAVAGAFFCGLLMMPGAIYLSLITGQGIAAAWVTLIIFTEVSRRAMRTLSQQELVILLMVAGSMAVGGPISDLIWRQYLVSSDAVRDIGLMGKFPSWYAPPPGSESLVERDLFHRAWIVPILLMVFMHVIGTIKYYTLSYFFFRVTSDIERLPFPFAGISAQGSMALSESGEKKTTWKWRVFSLGGIMGLVFGAVQVGVPLVTGTFLNKPIQIIPLPWYDATTLTEGILPATPTGMVIDLGLVITGMVIPFWAVIGTCVATVMTLVMNPVLHGMGVLKRWQPGMDTVSTTFENSIDFWMSFGLGVMGAIAVISIYQTIRDVVVKSRELRKRRAEAGPDAPRENLWEAPPGRGDYSPWIAVGLYMACSVAVIIICHILVPEFSVWWLVFFTFAYTPLISYINARLIGICGQRVDIPFVREAAFILSGYKGVEIWLAPIPVDNLGTGAQDFRTKELTGTNFWSYVKAQALIVPLSFVLSFVFWAFIWKSGAIPSELYPFAQKMWDLRAKQTVLLFSATLESEGAQPLFYQALHPLVISGGFSFAMIAFVALSALNLPIMAIYGFVQGIGHMPHAFIPIVIGAFIGKFYFHKRFGQKRFLEIVPVLVAGYGTGVGLIALMGVAINLISKAVSPAPF
ncbi:MAG: peptide transporter [Verrucomicrobia bacterium]|nr:peptide transporter [Verrucomicrobiota bacterium]MDA1086627.1 peptide transporter [Verrucomicrobiota bacterium]